MTTLNKTQVLEYLDANGICAMDSICVFCSSLMDGWDSICRGCRDYKGVMPVTDAVEYYGIEILGM
jgi:hypothetical protein